MSPRLVRRQGRGLITALGQLLLDNIQRGKCCEEESILIRSVVSDLMFQDDGDVIDNDRHLRCAALVVDHILRTNGALKLVKQHAMARWGDFEAVQKRMWGRNVVFLPRVYRMRLGRGFAWPWHSFEANDPESSAFQVPDAR